MKKLFTLIVFILAFTNVNAQAPQGFSYQATVRNSSGDLIANQNVYFKFNVMLNSSTSVPVFSETHYVPTDDLGQVNLTIGQGTATTGTFSTINWGTGNYYLGIELNTGNGYVAMGTTQLLSVPYALYANSAGNSQATMPNLATVLAVNNSANNTKITNLANPTQAQDAVTKSYLDASNNQLQTQVTQLQAQITALQNTNVTPIANVTIDTQVWATKNLDVTTYRDGTPIPEVKDATEWKNITTGAWCYYENTTANGTTYGKLYNCYAVAGIHDNDANTPNKILAPTGWHVPSDDEWTALTTFLGGESLAGDKMKETGTAHWNSANQGATNSSGFTALPGGCRGDLFAFIGSHAFWWSSSEYNTTSAWPRSLNSVNGNTERSQVDVGNSFGLSVRCLRD